MGIRAKKLVVAAAVVGFVCACILRFLLGSRGDMNALKNFVPKKLNKRALKKMAKAAWNPGARVPLTRHLKPKHVKADKQRLRQLGNAVIPACAAAAFKLLVHA